MNNQSKLNDGSSEDNSSKKTWMIIAVILAVIGLAFSVYSTNHHRELKAAGVTSASCNINQTINCDAVAASEYSEIFSIPLGVWGMGYFAALLILLGTVLANHRTSRENLQAYVILVLIGFLGSLVLGGISFFKIGSICLICIGIYGVTTLAGAALLVFRNQIPNQFSFKSVLSGGTTATIVVAATVSAYVLFMPKVDATVKTAEKPVKGPDGIATSLLPSVAEIPVSKSAYAGLGEDYRKGNDNAKVVITEFADFQCPACASVAGIMKNLAAEIGDRALVVFRNYPLDSACNPAIKSKMHEHACNVAILARCAGLYGKFWEYHDLAFGQQSSIKTGVPEEFAAKIGLTEAQIKTCKESPDILAKVKDDIIVGDRAGVDSTPTIFINGQKYVGERSLEALRREVDIQINK